MKAASDHPKKRIIYYGWAATTISFVSIMAGSAIRSLMIILFPPILAEFGWSRTTLSFAPSFFGSISSLCTLLIGIMSDRWNLKRIILIGASVAVIGLLLSRTINRPWQLFLYFGIVTAVGASALGLLPNTIIVSRWFQEKRGAAIGIIASGSGGGTLVFIPLIQYVISVYGWRSSFVLLALLVGVIVIPLTIFFQRTDPHKTEPGRGAAARSERARAGRPSVAGQQEGDLGPFLFSLARNRRFWLTYIQFILGPLSTAPIIIHQAAFFVDKGLGSMAVAAIVAASGLFIFLGMLASGFLSDRLSREICYSLGTIGLLIGCVCLLLTRPETGALLPMLYAFFFGLGFGSRPSMDSATAADIFGGRRFGLVFGILSTGLGIGQLIGPVLGGYIYDRTGSYTGVFIFCMIAVSVATLCIWLAAPRKGAESILQQKR